AGDPKVLDGLARFSAPESASFVRLGHETESSFGLLGCLLPGREMRAPLLDRVVTQHPPKRLRERLRLGPADVATACAGIRPHRPRRIGRDAPLSSAVQTLNQFRPHSHSIGIACGAGIPSFEGTPHLYRV